MPPLEDIQNYYGWEVSFYFAWMGFLSQWLVFPGVVGVLFLTLRWYRNDTVDNDEYTPFYGLITFLWGVLFLRFWQRHEHRLACQWGTESLSAYERQKYFSIRPDFRGFLRKSPVTGSTETYYPPIRRRLKYLGSAVVTIFMLLVAFTVMILSLNLQGYIHPQKNPRRWDDSNPHPFHVRSLAVFSEEGQPFDAKSAWRSMIPVILHVACIFTLNSIYRVIAGALTAWENHETTLNHRNSLILKRFLFEAFDCYVALFYLAFYERDVERLRMELINVFQIDTLRRVLLECIIPMLLQRLAAHTSRRQSFVATSPKATSLTTPVAPTEDSVLEDLDKDSYEQFDDYMEIVIQLGYVTLFASAYPLASLISIAANWVEIRSDCFKISMLCRRPDSNRTSGLGMWRALMASVIWMSALTNCLIAGFTSGQLTHYLPEFYIPDGDGNSIDHEDGWLVVFVIFGLERLLLVAGLLVFAVVPAIPEDVTDELERREYVRSQQRIIDAATLNDSKKND
jgi:anoctamin-10